MNLEFDTKQFERTLRRYLASTSKDVATALNTKAYELAWHTERNTKRASRAEIEQLGIVGHKLRKDRKTGRLKKGAAIHERNSRARAIVVGKRRKAGQELNNREITKEARQLVTGRLRAIGYLASGWIPAIKKLKPFSDFKKGGVKSRKRAGTTNTGNAVVATEQRKIAVIENALKALKNPEVIAKGEAALKKAALIVMRDIEQYFIKKMKKSAQKHGIPTR